MHYTHDEPPTKQPTRTGPAMLTHSDAPNATHYIPSELQRPWRANPTVNRERGYGVKTYQATTTGENAFYTQPGNPYSPVYKPQEFEVTNKSWNPSGAVTRGTRFKGVPQTKFQKFEAEREKLNAKEAAAAKPSTAVAKA